MTTTMRAAGWAGVLAMLVVAALPACAQTVEHRVNGAPTGNVTFHFAARANVCGDGQNYLRSDYGSWYGSNYDMSRTLSCDAGPVRVLLVRDGRDLLRIQTFAGPLATDPNATDLGAVPAAEAASYLLGLAKSVDGRPGRDALLPAMLADSTLVTRDLLAIAKDAQRTREVRRSALSYLVRRRGDRGELSADEVSRALTTIARDESETRTVRDQAMGSLARVESGEGLTAMVAMTEDASDSWMARRAVELLANSGDPRARPYLRTAAERTELTEEARVAAIGGIAGEYATSKDGEFLRGLYVRLNSDRLREAALSGVANIGGADSRQWIMGIARDSSQDIRQRRRAVELSDRIGVTASDLSRMYDAVGNDEVRSSIIGELAQLGTGAASDKLIAIAKNDASVSNRRRAIQALGRFDDPKVREALREIVGR